MSIFAPPGRVNGNPVWQYLGYAQITSPFSGSTGTSAQAVTGLSVTVTIPSNVTQVKITAFASDVFTSTGASTVSISIWSGTVGSGTQLGQGATTPSNITQAQQAVASAVYVPAAGSITYNVGVKTSVSADAPSVDAGTTFPAYILVECC